MSVVCLDLTAGCAGFFCDFSVLLTDFELFSLYFLSFSFLPLIFLAAQQKNSTVNCSSLSSVVVKAT